MALSVVFETHSTSVDNERGVATGSTAGSTSSADLTSCHVRLDADPLG
jgi:hypothetical protein